MLRGTPKVVPLVLCLLPFGLVVYLYVADKGSVAGRVSLIIIFGLLALRASGLKRAKGEVDPSGHVTYDTEFEGPTDDEREG